MVSVLDSEINLTTTYEDLIKQMGGPNTPAIGFAIGLERLILLAGKDLEVPRNTDIYIINQGLVAESLAIDLSRKLRNYDLLVELDLSGASFSKQFKKANKLKSKSIIVIGWLLYTSDAADD